MDQEQKIVEMFTAMHMKGCNVAGFGVPRTTHTHTHTHYHLLLTHPYASVVCVLQS